MRKDLGTTLTRVFLAKYGKGRLSSPPKLPHVSMIANMKTRALSTSEPAASRRVELEEYLHELVRRTTLVK